MNAVSAGQPPCKHCEARPGVTELGLCLLCDAEVHVRLLYENTRGLTPEREDRLRLLATRARRRLPLFDDKPEDGWMKAQKLMEKQGRATRALAAEFQRLVDGLVERLRCHGRRRGLRASAVNNLKEFIRRFGELKVGAPPEFARAVAEAREILGDWQPHELRNLGAARQEVADGLAQVSEQLTKTTEEHSDAAIPGPVA